MEIPHYYARMIYLDRIKPFIDTADYKSFSRTKACREKFYAFSVNGLHPREKCER